MSTQSNTGISKLCIHTITTKPWSIEYAARQFSASGIKGITVWRDALEGRSITDMRRLLSDHDLTVVSLCRGGFFPSSDPAKRKEAIDDNKRAIDEAAELGTNLIVLVCGADPHQSLEDSRKQIHDGIAEIISYASSAGSG